MIEPHGRLTAMGINASVSGAVQEDYITIEGERIFVRVVALPFPSPRGYIVLAEAPPPFGSPNYVGRKWRATTG